MEEYTNNLLSLLEESIRKCVQGQKKVGLIYSSGIDSTLVGVVASKIVSVQAYNVGIAGSPDTTYARKERDNVPFDVSFIEVSETDIEDALPVVLKAIGEPNPLKLAVGIPFYFASKKAKEDGFSVMLCGQGPDELFGGYSKYLDALASGGYPKLESAMKKDIESLYESQLSYDEHVCRLNAITLKFPYMDDDFVRFALSIPVELKIREASGKPEYACVDEFAGKRFIRKFALREAAKKAEVPAGILNRRKKAAQYGSGIQKTIEKIARKRGLKTEAEKEGRSDFVRFFVERMWNEVFEEGKKKA